MERASVSLGRTSRGHALCCAVRERPTHCVSPTAWFHGGLERVPVIGRMVGSTTVAEPGQPPLRPHSMKSSRCSGEDRRMSEPVESRDTAVFGKARHVGEDANLVLKASDVMSEAGRELEARSGQKPVAARSAFAMGLSFAMRCPTPLRKGERERAWIGSIVEGRLCGRLKMPLTCMSSSRFASRYQRVAMRADCGVRQALTSRRGASHLRSALSGAGRVGR